MYLLSFEIRMSIFTLEALKCEITECDHCWTLLFATNVFLEPLGM